MTRMRWCFLLSFSLTVQVAPAAAEPLRDPFVPPVSAQPCEAMSAVKTWQLKGVIGSASGWVGWLAQAHRWRRVTTGDVITPEGWQIGQVDNHGVALWPLASTTGCSKAAWHLPAPFQHRE